MQSELNRHLEKVHVHQKNDFRWYNLRKVVKNLIVGEKILDAGCGTGHMTLDLLRSNYDVTAIDYSDNLVNFTREMLYDEGYSPDVFSCDLLALKAINLPLFDSVICLDVIEHIENDNTALKNLHDTLNDNGTLVLSVPAIKKLYGQRDESVGHFRRYNKKELIEKINDAGFTVSTIRYWNFIGVLPVVFYEMILHKKIDEKVRYSRTSLYSRILHPALNLWFSLVENNIPFPCGLTLIAVCKKK